MRRVALALLLLLAAATPALGDDTGRKHQIDSQIATLQNTLTGQRKHEQALRSQVDDYTSRIRALESRVGDVSLKLTTLEDDLALHQKRLDALNALFHVQSDRLTTLRSEYGRSLDVLNKRLVDIYESDDPTTLDILFGSKSIQDAIDRVQALSDITAQDRAVSAAVAYAKTQVTAARKKTKKLRATVNAETAVIQARTDQTRAVRDELVGARNDLSSTQAEEAPGPVDADRVRAPGSI